MRTKSAGWKLTALRPEIPRRSRQDPNPPLRAWPLTHVPGYSFPDKLVVEFRARSAEVWFSVELALAYQPGQEWPELVEERRRPLPDWISRAEAAAS